MCACVRERGEGEGNGTIMFLASLGHSALCLCASVYVSLYPSGYRWRWWGGSCAFKAQSCPVRLFLCVYLSGCMAWKVFRLWLKSFKRLRYEPALDSLVEGQCAYWPFCLPHMETMWAIISKWPCQMGSHWKVHMLHHWPCQLGLWAYPTVNTKMRQDSLLPRPADTASGQTHTRFWQFRGVQRSMKASDWHGT